MRTHQKIDKKVVLTKNMFPTRSLVLTIGTGKLWFIPVLLCPYPPLYCNLRSAN